MMHCEQFWTVTGLLWYSQIVARCVTNKPVGLHSDLNGFKWINDNGLCNTWAQSSQGISLKYMKYFNESVLKVIKCHLQLLLVVHPCRQSWKEFWTVRRWETSKPSLASPPRLGAKSLSKRKTLPLSGTSFSYNQRRLGNSVTYSQCVVFDILVVWDVMG